MKINTTNTKKAFTLVEVLISIVLFTIIVIFLYQALDITKKTNNFYSKKLEDKKIQNELKKIITFDLLNKIGNIKILKDTNENSILTFKSSNIYHNPFYSNITYLLSRKGNLIRIESKNKFDKNKLDSVFLDTSFIDIIYSNIDKLNIVQKNNKVYFFIKLQNKKILIVTI